jgi:hypothetical protein
MVKLCFGIGTRIKTTIMLFIRTEDDHLANLSTEEQQKPIKSEMNVKSNETCRYSIYS